MATSFRLLNLLTLLSLFLILHSQITTTFDIEEQEDDSEYILDTPFVTTTSRLRSSRFLASIKKGTHCNPKTYNVCNGVSANNGTSILHCCKTHCRNLLCDRNNCGQCGHKCKMNERCCNGYCTDVTYNSEHCGKCNRKCISGERCEYGYCGYA